MRKFYSKLKYTFQLLFVMFFSLIFVTCSEDESQNVSSDVTLELSEIQEIGVRHNAALESVYNGLKIRELTNLKDKEAVRSIINSELGLYYKNTFKENEALTSARSKDEVSNYFSIKSSDLSPIERTVNEYSNQLSQNQIDFLLQIDEALESASVDYEKAVNKLNGIEEAAQKSLTSKEVQIIIIGAEIGKASLNYWNENFYAWQALFSRDIKNLSAKSWFSWGEVAGADVAGGVGAAVTTAIVNAAPGGGASSLWFSYCWGAAGASVGDAVFQVWNKLTE